MEGSPTRNVLIIDAETEILKLIKLILQRQGDVDDVVTVSSAAAGLDLAVQIVPALIIVRIMMPEMSGYEVCRHLRAIPKLQAVPILLQAAIAPEHVYSTAQSIGAAGYLYHPFLPQELLAACAAILAGGTYYPAVE